MRRANLGQVMGYQWPSWPAPEWSVDRTRSAKVLEMIRSNPDSRRLIGFRVEPGRW